MNRNQRRMAAYNAMKATQKLEAKAYCKKIDRAFSRLSEGCSERVTRAVSGADSYGRQIDKAIAYYEPIAQRREQKLRNKHMQILNESGREIHAVQRMKLSSKPLI